ncbi:protein pangolin, isoforms A/H/I/S-like [Anastrepha ludens]|uniref:protein pangolin, isoforms A/H/I/S-like n=1 Tax=Anastrepha ludens TaxID=28586 RepID=UPI0023B14B7C|nr:protein pangolin, isoforms A/H/I/S-like [Anastrepha ludens]
MLGPDMTPSWHTPSVYSAASSFRSPYPSSLPINTTLSSDFPFRFSPNLLPSVHTSPHHVLNSHPAIVTHGPKPDCSQEPTTNHRYSSLLSIRKQQLCIQIRTQCNAGNSHRRKCSPLSAVAIKLMRALCK